MPQYWTLFNENILVWFNLIQGLLLPFCLYIADTPFRDAVRFAFRRKQSTDFGDLLFSKPANAAGISTLPGYSFAPSSYLTALSDDFCRTEDASLLRIYHNNLATSSSSLAPTGQLNALNDTTKSSLNSSAKPAALNRNNSLHALQYSSNVSQKYPLPPLQFNQSFNSSPFSGRLPPKKFVSSNNVNLGSQAGFHSYANNDFLLLDKPPLGGPYSGAIHGAPDPRRSSFSCFLSSSGFPGYSTIAEKTHYYSQSKLNNDLLLNNSNGGAGGKTRNDLLTPTIKCYQQLFANSVKFEQQLNGLSSPHFVPYVANNAKFPSPTPYSQHHMTKTNPVYLTNEHFLPNSRKSVATSEIAFTGNENDKLKLDQRKSLCEGVGFSGKELLENQFAKQFRALSQQNKLAKNSSSRLYESPESMECPLLEQLNSLAASSDGGDFQSLIAKNLIGSKQPNTSVNGKFKCSRLANVGLLSNVSSLSQTGARVTPQSKMSRLLGNRKLDLKQVANKQKQRRSFSGEINCELLNSLDSVDEDGQQDWPQLIEEQEISKSDTERDGCETVWNYSIKQGDKHLYGCVYDDKAVVRKGQLDDSSLRKPKLIVDDQLNLVDIENAIRNSTNLLNLSVFNVASDEEELEELGSRLNLELLKNKEKKNKRSSDDCSVDDFELANDDFEFHTTKSICSKVQTETAKSEAKSESPVQNRNGQPKSAELIVQPRTTDEPKVTHESSEQTDAKNGEMKPENRANQIQTHQSNLKESNSFKEIKLAKQDSTKVNGLFKKRKAEAKTGHSPNSSGKIEADYRRKSITSITPLCSNQTRTYLNGKQSKSVSDLTAQFENCIQNKPNKHLPNIKESRERAHENAGGHQNGNLNANFSSHLNKRSTSESNLIAEAGKESTGLLPTSTALMLQLIRQSSNGQEANRHTSRGNLELPAPSAGQSPNHPNASKATKSTGSETITRKKRSEIRKTSSASSSDTNYTNCSDESNGVRRQSRYLKKDEQKISKKEVLVSRQSMLPVPSVAKKAEVPAKPRLQQPPHFRLLSASGLNLPKGQLGNKIINSNDKLTGSAANKSNYQIRPTPIAIVPNGSPVGVPVLRKFQQQQSTVYQPIYRNGLSNGGGGSHHASHHHHPTSHHHANHHANHHNASHHNASHHNANHSNRSACQQSAVQHRLNKQQSREIELLRRSNSSTSLALDACLLTSAHNKSMPNLFTQSNANHLFPYSFQ